MITFSNNCGWHVEVCILNGHGPFQKSTSVSNHNVRIDTDKHIAHYGWATLLISYYSPIILSFTFITSASIIPIVWAKRKLQRDQINTCGLIIHKHITVSKYFPFHVNVNLSSHKNAEVDMETSAIATKKRRSLYSARQIF